jgi:hypothetical protein
MCFFNGNGQSMNDAAAKQFGSITDGHNNNNNNTKNEHRKHCSAARAAPLLVCVFPAKSVHNGVFFCWCATTLYYCDDETRDHGWNFRLSAEKRRPRHPAPKHMPRKVIFETFFPIPLVPMCQRSNQYPPRSPTPHPLLSLVCKKSD